MPINDCTLLLQNGPSGHELHLLWTPSRRPLSRDASQPPKGPCSKQNMDRQQTAGRRTGTLHALERPNQADGGWTERKWWEYISLGWPSVGGTLNPSFQGEPRGGCLIPLLGGVVVMSFAQESHSWVSSDTSQLPTEARQFLRSRSLEIALYSRNPTSRCPDKPSSYLPIPLWSIPYPPNTEWQVRRVREATLGALPYAVAQ